MALPVQTQLEMIIGRKADVAVGLRRTMMFVLGMVTHQQALQGLAGIGRHMIAVRDLDGRRGAPARPIGVGAAAIAADNLPPRMLGQPAFQRGRRRIRQEVRLVGVDRGEQVREIEITV